MLTKALVSTEQVSDLVFRIFGDALHSKRCLSIANGVIGVMNADSLSIHDVGRGLARAREVNSKHAIKQVDRLLSNDGLTMEDAFSAWVPWLVDHRAEIVVTIDWTEYADDGHSRIAINLVTTHGRATPLVWKTVRSDTLKDHRSEYESDALDALRAALPPDVRVTVLGDRGFGDSSLYEYCDDVLHFDYVFRFRGCIKVWDEDGNLAKAQDWVPEDGSARRLDNARVTHRRYQVGAVVCVHDKKMKEAWCLATSRSGSADEAVGLYGRRFTTEETFRDEKDPHFGMGVLDTQIDDPARRDRLLLLLAIASALLTLIGAAGETVGAYRTIKANTSPRRQHSLFRQGREYVRGALEAHRYEDLRVEFRRVLDERRAAVMGLI